MYSFKRLSLPAAWLGALALMPAAASATVTQTSVTSPANKSNLLPLNTDMNVFSPFSELINVSGTAPGASDGDQLDVRCYNANGQFIPGPGTITVTVNNGKWTTADLFPFGAGFPISVGGPVKNAPASGGLGTMCNLRAVPAGTNPLDLRPYQPNAVGLGRLDTFDDSGLSGGPLRFSWSEAAISGTLGACANAGRRTAIRWTPTVSSARSSRGRSRASSSTRTRPPSPSWTSTR